MKVCMFMEPFGSVLLTLMCGQSMDYILFLTADVDVTPNTNEIRDYKYVHKAERLAIKVRCDIRMSEGTSH